MGGSATKPALERDIVRLARQRVAPAAIAQRLGVSERRVMATLEAAAAPPEPTAPPAPPAPVAPIAEPGPVAVEVAPPPLPATSRWTKQKLQLLIDIFGELVEAIAAEIDVSVDALTAPPLLFPRPPELRPELATVELEPHRASAAHPVVPGEAPTRFRLVDRRGDYLRRSGVGTTRILDIAWAGTEAQVQAIISLNRTSLIGFKVVPA